MKILIVSPIDTNAIKELERQNDVIFVSHPEEDELRELLSDREALVFRSGIDITADVMEGAPNLCLLIRAGSGIDNLDVDYVKQRGLKLVRIPGPGAEAVAEMSFALMLTLSRNLIKADSSMRMGEWAKYDLAGYLLRGKVLGVIGAGNIGSRVAQLGIAWGMKVIAHDGDSSVANAMKLSEMGVLMMSFDEVVTTADYICLHVPLNDSTYHLINSEILYRVKQGAYLINLARGGVVDEQALHSALVNGGRLRGAALDVHEQEGEGQHSPLAGLNNVILTPHIGAMTIDSQREIGRRVIEAVNSNYQVG